jgi:hypothetical protein
VDQLQLTVAAEGLLQGCSRSRKQIFVTTDPTTDAQSTHCTPNTLHQSTLPQLVHVVMQHLLGQRTDQQCPIRSRLRSKKDKASRVGAKGQVG